LIKPRDLIAVGLAALAGATAAWAYQAPGAGSLVPSCVFDWTTLEVVATENGERRAVFDAASATLDRVECHVTTVGPGKAPHAPHQHPEEELIIIKEGTLEVMQNGETRVAGPGSVIFEASNDLHGLRNVGDEPATYFVIKWWPRDLAEAAK
jgi:quercetin dioxygenase-like cupin family protein